MSLIKHINLIQTKRLPIQFVKHFIIRTIATTIPLQQIKNEDIPLHIFDRNTKHLQRERAAIATDVNLYDYLKDEIGYRLADRIFDIKRKFKFAADIGLKFV